MTLEDQVNQVNLLFNQLSLELNAFAKTSKLFCNAGCGKCCTNPTMEASPLEFLPWAFELFLNNRAETTLEKLNNNPNEICFNYQPTSTENLHFGSCNTYNTRGLVCRLFGYAATKNKYNELRLATCSIIKTEQTENYNQANLDINHNLSVPVFTNYYMQLSQIDFNLGNVYVQINKALQLALEYVLQYYTYRDLPENHINFKTS